MTKSRTKDRSKKHDDIGIIIPSHLLRDGISLDVLLRKYFGETHGSTTWNTKPDVSAIKATVTGGSLVTAAQIEQACAGDTTVPVQFRIKAQDLGTGNFMITPLAGDPFFARRKGHKLTVFEACPTAEAV